MKMPLQGFTLPVWIHEWHTDVHIVYVIVFSGDMVM